MDKDRFARFYEHENARIHYVFFEWMKSRECIRIFIQSLAYDLIQWSGIAYPRDNSCIFDSGLQGIFMLTLSRRMQSIIITKVCMIS